MKWEQNLSRTIFDFPKQPQAFSIAVAFVIA